jgi:cytidylate kinase
MKARSMKRAYDFSEGERGKCYKKGEELRLPIYLDEKLQDRVERLARKKGKDVGDVVNRMVGKEIELIDELS